MSLYCRKCGVRLSPDGSFCQNCGASQIENDQAWTGSPQQETAMIGTGRRPAGFILHQRYRLLHAVGKGGMGAVYVAQDTQLGNRLVAVKEMSMSRLTPQELPLAIELFRREAHLLASLQHPRLPVIYEYFREDARWYLVMSFIEGQNLQAVLNAAPGNRLPVNEVVRIGIELCEVLEYLHTHEPQVIFRDLKPSNIMLTPKGHICLVDFGIARHFKQGQTKDTAYYYSVGYAPPEQYGQSQTGPRSDIYSLGATLHQMLSGHRPADHPFQFPNLQLIDPTLPPPLVQVITRMLEMNKQARPDSVAAVKVRLEQVLAPEQIEPVKKAVTRKKTQRQTRAASSIGPVTSAPAPDNLWVQIERFLNKRRLVAWMCFIVLSLILGALLPWITSQTWGAFSSPFAIMNAVVSNSAPPAVTIIGTVGVVGVGLIFLLFKSRPPALDALGGIALGGIAFSNFALSQYVSYYDYYAYSYSSSSDAGYCIACYPFFSYYYNVYLTSPDPNHYFGFFIFFVLFSLWLFVGTRFFLRGANTPGGLLLGTLRIIGGTSLLWPSGLGRFLLSPTTLLPALICGICAAITIIASFRKRKRNTGGGEHGLVNGVPTS